MSEEVYGIPPEIETGFELQDGRPVLIRRPEIEFVNDKGGTPVGIHNFIGRRPIAPFGSSDGDLPMLQWTRAGAGRRHGLIVQQDDAEREYACDREGSIGHLDPALDAARPAGWVVVSMRDDRRPIFRAGRP